MRWILMVFFLAASVPAGAQLSSDERVDLHIYLNSLARTLSAKKLSPKFIQAQLRNLKSDRDRVLFQNAVHSWSRGYSSKLNYVVYDGSISVMYHGHTVIRYTMVSVNPLVVKINDKVEVDLNGEHPLTKLIAAVKSQGYLAEKRKSAAVDLSLIPRAEAASASKLAGPVVVLASGLFSYNRYSYQIGAERHQGDLALNVTKKLAQNGMLYPQWWNQGVGSIFRGLNSQEIKCDGNKATGQIKDARGAILEFEATRKGVVFKDSTGAKVRGTSIKAEFEYDCKTIESRIKTTIGGPETPYYISACRASQSLRTELDDGERWPDVRCNWWYYKPGDCDKVQAAMVNPPVTFEFCKKGEKCRAFEDKRETFESLHLKSEGKNGKNAMIDYYSNENKTTFIELAAGTMGLLDCCVDTSCRKELEKSQIKLAPTKKGSPSEGGEATH